MVAKTLPKEIQDLLGHETPFSRERRTCQPLISPWGRVLRRGPLGPHSPAVGSRKRSGSPDLAVQARRPEVSPEAEIAEPQRAGGGGRRRQPKPQKAENWRPVLWGLIAHASIFLLAAAIEDQHSRFMVEFGLLLGLEWIKRLRHRA